MALQTDTFLDVVALFLLQVLLVGAARRRTDARGGRGWGPALGGSSAAALGDTTCLFKAGSHSPWVLTPWERSPKPTQGKGEEGQ